jgi:hypothetical protein
LKARPELGGRHKFQIHLFVSSSPLPLILTGLPKGKRTREGEALLRQKEVRGEREMGNCLDSTSDDMYLSPPIPAYQPSPNQGTSRVLMKVC